MTAKVSYGSVEVGTELPAQSFPVTRATLVQYAGASGDFNPIHWNEKFAREVGLPDVIAHGMFTMAEAVRVVTDLGRRPGRGRRLRGAVHQARRRAQRRQGCADRGQRQGRGEADDNLVRVDLVAMCDGKKVLGMSRAVVRLA